uniref:Uncharacterized protein n=1 Tax=Heterorhabditis bacteriophora TaxID=37862 RepID=A0A1I7X1H2_HETBA
MSISQGNVLDCFTLTDAIVLFYLFIIPLLEPDPPIPIKDKYAQIATNFKYLYNPQDLRPVLSTGSPPKTSKFINRQIAPGVSIVFVRFNFAYYC